MSIEKKYNLFIIPIIYLLSSNSLYLGVLGMITVIVVELVFLNKWKLNLRPIIFFLLCIFSIILIGFISKIGSNEIEFHDVLRDMIFFLFPAVALLFGYLFFSNMDIRSIYLSIILAGIITAFIQIINFVHDPMLILQSVRTIREVAGTGYDAPVIATLIIIFIYNPFANRKKMTLLVLFVLLLSILLSFSRSNYLIFSIGLLMFFSLSKKKSSKIKYILLVLIAAIVGIYLLPDEVKNGLIDKFKNSLNEVSTNSNNFSSWSSINDNWRGYENYRVKQEIMNSGLKEWLIGFGIGTRLPLNLSIMLAGKMYNSIPTMHSGYSYLLFKDGYSGIIILFFIYIHMIRDGFRMQAKVNRDFILYVVLIFIIKGITIGGLFNAQAAVIFLAPIGGLLAIHTNRYTKKEFKNG